MSNPDVDTKTEKAQEILKLYRDLENANLRKLSHVDFSVLDIDEKKRALLQIEFDTNKQRNMFLNIIGESKVYIADVLVKLLRDDVNKDTLWRLFGDVIYENIKRNLDNTKICQCCGQRFEYVLKQGKPPVYCGACAKNKQLEKFKKYYSRKKK